MKTNTSIEKHLFLLSFILLFQYSYAQDKLSPHGYWSINAGANYLRPNIMGYGLIDYEPFTYQDVYSNYEIKPVGGFGNYIEIGKGFNIFSDNNIFDCNLNVNISYNWTSSKTEYLHQYKDEGKHFNKRGEIAYRLHYPSLAIQGNNIVSLNNKFGLYQALGVKCDFLYWSSYDFYSNYDFYIPLSLGLVINFKKFRLIPIYSVSVLNFFDNTYRINSNDAGGIYLKDYFQTMELGLSIHFNKLKKQ